ncbi:uncharacterized protein CcaverHIS019_0405630 [Cutaneotrichosporon cavernicola]|uniref:DDHD domain-containing protein n=1 Tax=Cutaneotrichosporon cavernicola TaxID=279322 RepID=A0AA48QVV7_9TREE|nr:uncharacterized protein CcaverHIS019_0405630 [Cutaneotrichosporon cavernicola]BEI91743.1 hypothetical protein CcaverHIS019_0405630 [Cutaneotrichosporon cavernicola]
MSTDATQGAVVTQEAATAQEHVEMERLEVRWMHTGAKHLSLPIAPITAVETAYKAFSMDESNRIEIEWEKLSERQQAKIIRQWGSGDGEWSPKERSLDIRPKKVGQKAVKDADEADDHVSEAPSPQSSADKAEVYKSIIERARTDPTKLDVVHGVPVAQDSLFEVDLDTLSLHPVFWPQSGPRVPVLRGTWYVENEKRPCSWDLAIELEKAYQKVKPWQPAYKEELYAARILASNGDEKLKYELPNRFGEGIGIVFEDAVRGRLVTSGALNVLSRAIWLSFGEATGSYVYRGYTAAEAAQAPVPMAALAPVEEDSGPPEAIAKSLAKSGHSTPDREDVDSATDKNKNDKWPKSAGEFFARAKKEIETRQKSIEEQNVPVTRSHNDDEPCTDLVLVIHGIGQHLATQYESLNFIYAANQFRQVLRKQSDDPSISSVADNRRCQVLPVQWRTNLNIESGSSEEDAAKEESNTFTFADITIGKSIPYVREVTNSVLLDIPLFMSDHRLKMIEAVCQQANKLYRMWVARHPDFEKHGHEAELHQGNFGCMAVDSVYNIFYYTDPVAYALNATVDVRVGKKRPPLAIPSVTGSFFPTVALPSMPALPSMSGVTKYLPFGGVSKSESKPKKDLKQVELSEDERLAGTRGERRFSALNPRGSVDFFLPSSGVNDYVDMLTAHLNYWADPNFSAFILNESFTTPENDTQTGKASDGQ